MSVHLFFLVLFMFVFVRVCVYVTSAWDTEIFLLFLLFFFQLWNEKEKEHFYFVVLRWYWWVSIVVTSWSNFSSYLNVLSLSCFFLLLYRCCFYSKLNCFVTIWYFKRKKNDISATKRQIYSWLCKREFFHVIAMKSSHGCKIRV